MADEPDFEVKLTSFGNGSIRLQGQPVDGQASETPSHYQATFMVSSQTTIGSITVNNDFLYNGVVLTERGDAPYRDIEDAAARGIPAMLRSLADQIDQKIAEFDEKNRKND